MISGLHAIGGAVVAFLLWRALAQVWVDELTSDQLARDVVRWAIPLMSAAASALAVGAGIVTARPRRLLVQDAVSWGALLVVLLALAMGRLDRDYLGVLFVIALAIRLAPSALASIATEAPVALLFAVAFTAYASLAAWHQPASLPLGDQVHYLLAADRLAHGSVDATLDPALFRQLTTLTPSDADIGTHALATPLGPRAIQGYALPLLLLPGWVAAGRLGAELVVALFAAWASVMTALILRDTVPWPRLRGPVWAMATFLAPAAILAFHVYPNAFGAAAIATAYRFGFTAPTRRSVLAGVAAGLTLFLNPRDGLLLLVLLVAAWWLGKREFARFAIAVAAVGVVVVISNALLYEVPLPYAGYLGGILNAQQLTHESTLSFTFWVGLPAMLFDRTFGVAGVAPWLFIAVVGAPAALIHGRRVLVPAAIAIAASLAMLSIYRYWEGGYAPSARYFVDMLPLLAPFVAYGLRVACHFWMRAVFAILIGVSALATLVLAAMPARALNDAFQQQVQEVLDQILGVNPIGWLPSFEVTTSTWYVSAYLWLVPALALFAALSLYGWRRRGATEDTGRAFQRDTVPWFVAANAVALAIAVFALIQPWLADIDDVATSLTTRWLPFALALATGVSALIGWHLDRPARRAFFARHFALYIAVPLVLLALRSSFIIDTELGAIYVLLAAGFAANSLHALWTLLPSRDDGRIAVLLGTLVLAVALIVLPFDRTIAPTASDEPHYLIIMQSLVLDHDLDLANDYAGDRYFTFYPQRLPDVHGIHVGDAIYSIRDLGLPLLGVVPFAIAGRTGVLALQCLVLALLAIQLFLLLRELAFDRRVTFLAVAATVLMHPLLTYSTQVYPELLVALAFVTAARLLRRGTLSSARDLALASALAGTLPWLSTRAWFMAVGLGLVIAYAALWPRRAIVVRAAAGALPFAALVLVLGYVNWREFGLFLPSAGYFLVSDQQPVVVYTPWSGATGLLFDATFGLIPRAPIYLLGFLGIATLWRRLREGHAAAILVLALPWLLSFAYIANIAYWYADGSPASRYLVGAMPFLVVAVAAGIETVVRSRRVLPLATAWGAAAITAFITYVFAVLPHLRYDLAVDIRAGELTQLWSVAARVIRPDPEVLFPAVLRAHTLDIAVALIWIAIAVGLAVAGVTLRTQKPVTV